MLSTLLVTAFGLSMIAAAQDASLDRVGPIEEIYESYNDCFAATQGAEIDAEKLVELGWSRAQSEGEGDDSPIFFARTDRAPLIMLSAPRGRGVCVVMAGFDSTKSMRKFLGAWGDGLPEFKDGQLGFFAEGHPIIFKQAGSQKKPRLNLVVGMGPEAKE